ncbi:MAG: hypothetical protein ACQEV0_03970 [Bacillota bacterium]
MVIGKKGDVDAIEVPVIMYILFVGMALVMGALSAIIFVNIFRNNKRLAVWFGVLASFGFIYQLFVLYNISLSLGTVVLVVYLFFVVAAYRKLKAGGSVA